MSTTTMIEFRNPGILLYAVFYKLHAVEITCCMSFDSLTKSIIHLIGLWKNSPPKKKTLVFREFCLFYEVFTFL